MLKVRLHNVVIVEFINSISWFTLANALLKSRRILKVPCPYFHIVKHTLFSSHNNLVSRCAFLKPELAVRNYGVFLAIRDNSRVHNFFLAL